MFSVVRVGSVDLLHSVKVLIVYFSGSEEESSRLPGTKLPDKRRDSAFCSFSSARFVVLCNNPSGMIYASQSAFIETGHD